MSGHNKWSTIKRKKGAEDAKRSKIFSRITKEIDIAVKENGPDEDCNPRLRLAIQNAKGANMPKDNILRAIHKADKDPSNLQEITFEGYASGGIAVIVECLSDNKNRTVSNIRAIFTKRGGNLGTNGSVSFMFERKAVFTVSKGSFDMDDFQLEMIDAGVENIDAGEDIIVLTAPIEEFGNVQKKLEKMNITPKNSELQRIANDTKTLDLESAKKVLNIIDDFEEDDDVQNVFHNMELTDEIQKELEK